MATDHNFRIKNGLTVGSVEVIDSSGKLTANAFGTNSNEKIEDVVADMITGSTHSNITVTYNDTNGTLAFAAAAQYGDSDVEDYLDGGTSTPIFSTINSGAITSTSSITGRTGTFTGQNGTALEVNSGTTNVTATFESGDATAWINLKDSNSSTYGTLLGAEGGLFRLRTNNNDATTDLTVDTSGNLSVSGAILSTQANNNDIEVRSVGDYFPSLTIARTSGTTKTNYEWNLQIGSSGYLNFKDITNGYYPLIFRNNGDVYLASDTSSANPVLILDQSAASATFSGTISSGAITSSGASSGRYTGLEVVNTTNAGGTETAIGLGVVAAGNNACDVKLVANRVAANSGSDFYIEQTDSSGSQQETLRITESGNATFSGTVTATGGNSTNWNTAYSWGNHASAGYLTSSSSVVTNKLPLAGGTMTGNIDMNGNNIVGVNILQFQNREISNFTGARQMIIDANDGDSNVPAHGDYASSYPMGIYFTGDNDQSTTTLGNGLVKLWHTGHFKKAHIDYFVGLYDSGVTTTEYDYLDGVTSNIQTQLNSKLTSSSLSGYATESYVGTQISNLVDSAPGTLNTLNELAAALGDDANFSTTVTNSIATKMPLAGGTFTGGTTYNVGGDAITISSSAPQIRFSDTTSGADDFWIHINSDRFYVLADRADDGSWETPHPLELHAGSTNIGYIFGQRAFTEAYHPNADKWTTARTLSLTGDVTGSVSWDGSGNASITTTVVNDSHNHNHSDGNFTVNGVLQAGAGSNHISTAANPFRWQRSTSSQTGQDDNVSVYVDDSNIYFTHNNDADGDASGFNFRYTTGGTATNLLNFSASTMTYKGNTVFHDGYHPNADKWTTPRTLSLTGAVTGSVSWDGSGNASIATTATSDPTLTLSGDASGSATFTNLGNATLSVTVANDSHTHDGRYYTESESDSRYWRKNETGSGADFGPWYSTGAYIYDSTNGTRYFWNLLGTIAASSCRGSIEYEFKDDENYPNFVKGTIAFAGFSNGGSFSVQHDQHTQDPHGVQVRLDTSRRIWIRANGVDWAHYFRFRVHNQSGNFTTNTSWSTGSTRYDTLTNSVPPNSSNDILSGQNLRATSSSVTGTVPSYNNFNYFGRVYARDLMHVNGNLVWHAGNDGANSGLDADLLDGQEGSYYLNYNNLTNVPASSSNADTLDNLDSTQFLRSDVNDVMTGELNITSNTGVTGSSAPSYTNAKLEIQTSSNHVPAIAFHRGGYSATALYEYDGELYTNAWITRAQTGKLLSSGNIDSYASAYKYVFAKNNGTHNGGTATATVAQDGLFIDGTNGITTSASGDNVVLSGANLLRSDTDDTTVGTLTVNKTNDGIGLIVTRPANGNYSGTIVVGATNVGHTLVDSNRRPMVVVDGQYPVLNLNHTATTNDNHGPTIQFTHNDYNSNRQWVIGTDGQGSRLDFGVSGGTAGANTDKNPHRGIAGYNGVTIARMFQNGVLIGNTGVYPNEITAPNAELDVRGSLYVEANTDETSYSGVHSHVIRTTGNSGGGNGAQLLVQNDRGNHSWGTVAEFRINTAGDTDNPSIIFTSAAEGTNSWGVGFGYTDTNFRINRDHGHLSSNWGVAMMTLDRSGNATFAGNVTAYSDERLKENIETIPDAIETVKKIRGVTFDWKETGEEGMGVIAQEIEEVPILKRLVNETPKDGVSEFAQKNVAYGNMVGLLIEAVKEQQEQIEELKSIINTLMESK